MAKSLFIREFDGIVTIKFSYDREFDLGYKKQAMHYEKVLKLQ
jgi:hypothetical protein